MQNLADSRRDSLMSVTRWVADGPNYVASRPSHFSPCPFISHGRPRCCMPSASAATGSPQEDRDYLRGWSAQGSDRHSKVAKHQIVAQQRTVMAAIQDERTNPEAEPAILNGPFLGRSVVIEVVFGVVSKMQFCQVCKFSQTSLQSAVRVHRIRCVQRQQRKSVDCDPPFLDHHKKHLPKHAKSDKLQFNHQPHELRMCKCFDREMVSIINININIMVMMQKIARLLQRLGMSGRRAPTSWSQKIGWKCPRKRMAAHVMQTRSPKYWDVFRRQQEHEFRVRWQLAFTSVSQTRVELGIFNMDEGTQLLPLNHLTVSASFAARKRHWQRPAPVHLKAHRPRVRAIDARAGENEAPRRSSDQIRHKSEFVARKERVPQSPAGVRDVHVGFCRGEHLGGVRAHHWHNGTRLEGRGGGRFSPLRWNFRSSGCCHFCSMTEQLARY